MIKNNLNSRYALDLSLDEWKGWCSSQQLPAYVGKQVFEWIFRKGILKPSEFSNISASLRELLQKEFLWDPLTIDSHLTSQDGSQKFLLRTHDNLLAEMVLMPSENRTTLCISCQVGCKMGCTFC